VCGWARDTLGSGPEAAVAPGHGACGMRRLDGTDGLTPLREPCVTAQPPKRSALRVIPRAETAARTVRAAREPKGLGSVEHRRQCRHDSLARAATAGHQPTEAGRAVSPHGHTGCVRWRAVRLAGREEVELATPRGGLAPRRRSVVTAGAFGGETAGRSRARQHGRSSRDAITGSRAIRVGCPRFVDEIDGQDRVRPLRDPCRL
jgi:hypothetical protein